jgi:zinc transporter ZupT
MNSFLEIFFISTCMFGLCLIPLYSESIRKYSQFFYLLGTGALAGILIFDLIPDLFEIGGRPSLYGVAIVWLVYSIIHLVHLKHHKNHDLDSHAHGEGSALFLTSMIGHCVASGMLLVVSESFSGSLNRTIFWALFAHKSYESLTVSSVLIRKQFSRARFMAAIFAYSIAMPVGVVLATTFRASITMHAAFLITSLAAGTLAGCLVFDFLIPSLNLVKSPRKAITWILVGLSITQIFMKTI